MRHLFVAVVTLFWISFCPDVEGQEHDQIFIRDVLTQTSVIAPTLILGWENCPFHREIIVDPISLRAAFEKKDLAAIGKVISDQTDYECIIDDETFVVVPKIENGLNVLPLVKRQVIYPTTFFLPLEDFLRTVHGLKNSKEDHVTLLPEMTLPPGPSVKGPITIIGDQTECYKLLTELCKTLAAKSWTLSHGYTSDLITHQIIRQPLYHFGALRFNDTGEFHNGQIQ